MVPVEGVTRHEIHLRRITCKGHARSDGLWDLEAHLIDTRPDAVVLPEGTVEAHEAIHEMRVVVTIDGDFVIRDAVAHTLAAPYGVCGDIVPRYRRLIGERIGPGFTLFVKRLFRGEAGCTHLTELLPLIATMAYQVLFAERLATDAQTTGKSPLGQCHALRLDGPVVLEHFPNGFGRS